MCVWMIYCNREAGILKKRAKDFRNSDKITYINKELYIISKIPLGR